MLPYTRTVAYACAAVLVLQQCIGVESDGDLDYDTTLECRLSLVMEDHFDDDPDRASHFGYALCQGIEVEKTAMVLIDPKNAIDSLAPRTNDIVTMSLVNPSPRSMPTQDKMPVSATAGTIVLPAVVASSMVIVEDAMETKMAGMATVGSKGDHVAPPDSVDDANPRDAVVGSPSTPAPTSRATAMSAKSAMGKSASEDSSYAARMGGGSSASASPMGMSAKSASSSGSSSSKSKKSKKNGMSGKKRVRRDDDVAVGEEEGSFAWQVVGSGERDILIMRVNYNGNTPSYCDENCVRDNMWDGSNNVNDLYNQISYGAITFPKSKGRVITVTVNGGLYSGGGCKFWEIGLEADAAARRMGVEPNSYSHRSYYIPSNIGGCTFGGLGYVGCSSTYCKTWIRQGAGGTLAHELGHNLGVWHSAVDGNNDGVQDSEYGDNSDVMGSSTNWRGMNAPHRMAMDWVPFANVKSFPSWEMTCQQSNNLQLASLSRQPNSNRGYSVASFSRLAAGRGTYFVSLRTAHGVDNSLASVWKNRVYVHYHAAHSTRYQVNSQLVKVMGTGDKFADDVTGVHMEVTSIDSSTGSAIVKYDFCAPGETPVITTTEDPANTPAYRTTHRPDVAPGCIDSDPARCEFWRDKGYCDEDNVYFNYMKANCKSACDLCLLAAKDGFDVEEEAFESRPHCVPLVKYQLPPPTCDPSGHGLPCCSPTMCLPTDDSNSVFRCLVPLTIRGGAEGDTCTRGKNCEHSCDRGKWQCTGPPSRYARSTNESVVEEVQRQRREAPASARFVPPEPTYHPPGATTAAVLACTLLLGVAIGYRAASGATGGTDTPASRRTSFPRRQSGAAGGTLIDAHPTEPRAATRVPAGAKSTKVSSDL
eukprot:m.344272 g.344272  ORF g.344272 m.344272 type:complete len:873 (+) comp20644_c0_seq1:123-2741(+)